MPTKHLTQLGKVKIGLNKLLAEDVLEKPWAKRWSGQAYEQE